MANLDELDELTYDLKKRIQKGNDYDFKSETNKIPSMSLIKKEHGQPYKSDVVVMTLMCGEEHGQPYKSNMTYMGVKEHGQPYKSIDDTRMCVNEHGQPYKSDVVVMTNMCRKEHGQPYKPKSTNDAEIINISDTFMVNPAHGQPYKFKLNI